MNNFFRILDKKQYELKDHLGNVRVAIGDMKIHTAVRGEAPFVVDEKSVSDFYPGGMSISDRSWQGTSYRYGYNAQEKSLEIDASGNHHTAEFWEVNNASLRRWNLDPVNLPWQSQYSVFGNNSIKYNDLFGLSQNDPNKDKNVAKGTDWDSKLNYENTNFTWDQSKSKWIMGSLPVVIERSLIGSDVKELNKDGSEKSNNSQYTDCINNNIASNIYQASPVDKDWLNPNVSYEFSNGLKFGFNIGLLNINFDLGSKSYYTKNKSTGYEFSVNLGIGSFGFGKTHYISPKKVIYSKNTAIPLPIGYEYFEFLDDHSGITLKGITAPEISNDCLTVVHIIMLNSGESYIGTFKSKSNPQVELGISFGVSTNVSVELNNKKE